MRTFRNPVFEAQSEAILIFRGILIDAAGKGNERMLRGAGIRLDDRLAGAQNIEFERSEIVRNGRRNTVAESSGRSGGKRQFIGVRAVNGDQAAAIATRAGADRERGTVIDAVPCERLVELKIDGGDLRLQFGGLFRGQTGKNDFRPLCHCGRILVCRVYARFHRRLILRDGCDCRFINRGRHILCARRGHGDRAFRHRRNHHIHVVHADIFFGVETAFRLKNICGNGNFSAV